MLKNILIAWALFGFSQSVGAEPYKITSEGVVQELNLGAATAVIAGYRFSVPPSAQIRVAGDRSSLAGVVSGMKVRFVYEVFEGLDAQVNGGKEKKVILELEQLPDSFHIDEF